MNCTLMHRKIPVAQLELDDTTGFIQKINMLLSPEHLPVGVPVRHGTVDRAALNDWWTERSIPASRSGVREALETLQISSTKMLLVRCYGLSLSDQYWICPVGSNLCWENINFFHNTFSDDIGDVLFGENRKKDVLNLSSPDNTSDGNLKKRWKIIDGRRVLLKGGSNPFRQQPFNEVIATELMRRLRIPHVPYRLVWDQGAPYSVCEDFVDENTELVPAWRIMQTQKRSNSVSVYRHFVDCCAALGIPNIVPFLDRMIVVDYLLANEDRHLNNFGAIRDAQTLQWLGMAPIYDSGSSLGYDRLPAQMRTEKDVPCKPFKNHHNEQLKLVTDWSWIDFDALADMRTVVETVLTVPGAADYMDAVRIRAISEGLERRTENVRLLAMSHQEPQEDTTQDDVQENMAQSY